MSDFVTSPLVVALAAQIVAGLLTGVSFWWKDHRDRRDLAKSRQAFLTQLGDEISIIETWVKAYDLVAPPDARPEGTLRAKQHLERAYNRLTEFLDDARKIEIPTVPRQQAALETQQVAPVSKATSPGFFKTVFLVRQFHTIPAKISRILYLHFPRVGRPVGRGWYRGYRICVECRNYNCWNLPNPRRERYFPASFFHDGQPS